MRRLYITLLSLFCILVMASTVQADTSQSRIILKGICTSVADGDTYKATVSINGVKKEITVRCDGIDAPEKGQRYGKEAKEYLEQLILNRNVLIWDRGTDRYGRTLGQTIVKTAYGNVLIELAMIDAGCAWHFKEYNSEEKLANAEISARKRKVGLWKVSNPMPPWQYRAEKRGGYYEADANSESGFRSPSGISGGLSFDPTPRSHKVESYSTQNGFYSGGGNGHSGGGNHTNHGPFPTYSNVETNKAKYWYNTKTHVYHNPGCQYYGCPNGIKVDTPRGRPCMKCGG